MFSQNIYYDFYRIYRKEVSEEQLHTIVTIMEELPYDIEVVASNLNIPWAIAISKDGKVYVTERTGTIRVINEGKLQPEPLISLESPFVSRGEGGLLGIALDPDFEQNHYIYVMHTYQEGSNLFNRVVRLVEENGKAVLDRVIIDRIPGGSTHDGGRIKIGPDRKLYVATGDAGTATLSQDVNSTAGKILRLELDGSIPQDNPFVNSPVYSLGLRNPQGLTWRDDMLYATDHGQFAHDEVDLIKPGLNYGWPIVEGDEVSEGLVTEKAIIHSDRQTWAPSGIAYIDQGPWQGKLLVAGLASKKLLSMSLNDSGTEVVEVENWLTNEYGRLREVIHAEDGSIYLTTSNRDGRGFPETKDDRVLRLIPKK
ncbi:MAG TPA: PQQ-dependent sugar dehydrogenase [Lachnospiraceae bacterium]|nr:PQQ-dependent sugar dehydrogenase [Lachnospiraceae bacterium]